MMYSRMLLWRLGWKPFCIEVKMLERQHSETLQISCFQTSPADAGRWILHLDKIYTSLMISTECHDSTLQTLLLMLRQNLLTGLRAAIWNSTMKYLVKEFSFYKHLLERNKTNALMMQEQHGLLRHTIGKHWTITLTFRYWSWCHLKSWDLQEHENNKFMGLKVPL